MTDEIWDVYDKNANSITQGLQTIWGIAKRTCQRIANERGESVFAGPSKTEWEDLIEFKPEMEG